MQPVQRNIDSTLQHHLNIKPESSNLVCATFVCQDVGSSQTIISRNASVVGCYVLLEKITISKYQQSLRQPSVLLKQISWRKMQTAMPECKVFLTVMNVSMYCDILRKPIVCLGNRLSKIFKEELTKVDTSDVKFITPKFSSGKKDLIRPTVKLNADVQKLLDQILQHPQKAQIHFCSECPTCYGSAKSLYGHVHLIHKGEFKFQCQKCHRKFLNKHHYETHRRLHLNKLKYVCKKVWQMFRKETSPWSPYCHWAWLQIWLPTLQ